MANQLNHTIFMRRCIELALRAGAQGNTPVGALIVRDGVVIAEGVEAVASAGDVSAHAELEAIRVACARLGTRRLAGAILYSTAEPCVMCSYAIRQTGIGTVVLGSLGSRLGGVTSPYAILVDANLPGWGGPPEVIGPVLREECERLTAKSSG